MLYIVLLIIFGIASEKVHRDASVKRQDELNKLKRKHMNVHKFTHYKKG